MVNIGNAPNNIDNINDLWYALNEGGLLSDTIRDDVDDAIKTRNYGLQPDGDLVGEMASGELFNYEGTLAAGETFTSDWYDTDGFSSVGFYVSSSETGTTDGIKIQFTTDSQGEPPTVDSELVRTYDQQNVERGFNFYEVGAHLDGVRIVYENNSHEANFQVVATARTQLSLDGAEYVHQNTQNENYVRVGNNHTGKGLKVGQPKSLFDDLTTIERSTVVDLVSTFGTSTLRDEITSTGSAQITGDPNPSTGEIELSTGTTADSSITLSSAEYGRYTPGYSAQAGMGIRLPSLPTEGEARWGYFDDNNGFYWGYDGDQDEMFIARRSGGSESERVYRSEWNRHPIEDVLAQSWSPTQGAVYQIDFSWYGFGIIQFGIVGQTANRLSPETPRQTTTVVHAISVEGETSTEDPNQPIRVEAENSANGEDFSVNVGGRQFSVFGDIPSGNRATSETVVDQSLANGSWNHVMSWSRDSPNTVANSRITLDGFDWSADQTSRIALVINANISGTNFVTPSLTNSEETLLAVSTDGTFDGMGNGTKVWEGHLNVGSQGNAQSAESPEVDLSVGQEGVVSLLAYGVGDTGLGTATVRMKESW